VYIDLDQDSKLRDLQDRAAEAVAVLDNEGAGAKIEVCIYSSCFCTMTQHLRLFEESSDENKAQAL
jgi:hypothetical protein